LLLFDEGLNNADKVIFESFFSATNADDLRKKIENVDIDKFRPIKNLLEGSIENPTTVNLELTAILISYKKRPYKNYSKCLELGKKVEISEEGYKSQITNEESISAPQKKRNFKKMLYGGVGVAALSVFGIIGNSYNSKNEFQCMQWQVDHYERVDCEMKNVLGATSISQIEVINENSIGLKKINVTPETTFFIKDRAVVYYCKMNDSILEYYNASGFHPILGKPLKPITKYIIKKYIK
jgi:hypothetical protein